MGKPKLPHKVKLFTGFLFRDPQVYKKAKAILSRKFGPIDFESRMLPFNYTDYYRQEFGPDLVRAFTGFSGMIAPENLSRIKLITNSIEAKLSKSGKRTINIDPGYIDMGKLVLASTKDYTHRIYLRDGIYAEITLAYRDKSYRPYPWTYPDYSSAEYIAVFNSMRETLIKNPNKNVSDLPQFIQ